MNLDPWTTKEVGASLCTAEVVEGGTEMAKGLFEARGRQGRGSGPGGVKDGGIDLLTPSQACKPSASSVTGADMNRPIGDP